MQRIAIRPPEYFPRPEYFALMMAVDLFIVADTFQYSRQSFQNRARVRTPDGWSWISIPLAGGQHGRAIREVQVDSDDSWWGVRHWRTLEYNYRSSPFFEYYEDTVAPVVRADRTSLAGYTIDSVLAVRSILQIDTRIVVASEMESPPVTVDDALAEFPNAELWTLPESEIADGSASSIFEWAAIPYPQNFPGFEAGMSALDLIFNCGNEAARRIAEYDTRPRSTVGGRRTVK